MSKLYRVKWEETMYATVWANNEKEAKNAVLNGEVEAENAELASNFSVEVIELKEVN